jgi:hypothetical protein
MDEAELYYTSPTDEVFNEVKEKCIAVWNMFDNEFGYVDEKVNRIKDLPNTGSNLMSMVLMFHMNLQRELSKHLSDEANEALMLRLLDGGADVQFIPFFPK